MSLRHGMGVSSGWRAIGVSTLDLPNNPNKFVSVSPARASCRLNKGQYNARLRQPLLTALSGQKIAAEWTLQLNSGRTSRGAI